MHVVPVILAIDPAGAGETMGSLNGAAAALSTRGAGFVSAACRRSG
jgi:hypothetical protein